MPSKVLLESRTDPRFSAQVKKIISKQEKRRRSALNFISTMKQIRLSFQ
ncbi:hypothetical protein FZC78_00390 [Rossellomorea vietnamensis]|uniref:Uncharacterized protein n=1 Tax=Rossellomorea vietnamensis TaxID=218284 RepID=A0A5D4NYW7_9BACI|nr:hypothetical protein FZC78_00390 [Rossellomorea vietnamensis]